MKKGLFIFILLLSFSINAQDSFEVPSIDLNWQQKFSRATSKAKSSKKPMLIFFTGSDWCGPCKMLKADFFETQEFAKLAKKEFILYEADFPRNKNLVSTNQAKENAVLKKKYEISSFPTIVIIDSKGELLGKRKGYNLLRDASYHFDFIKSILK